MDALPVSHALDRTIRVPPGCVVKTGYVDVFKVRLECRERMAVGDIAAAFQKAVQLGSDEQFPCPTGKWNEETFHLADGRHHWLACVMLGKTHILVSWLEGAE